jgi:hypothetical protein
MREEAKGKTGKPTVARNKSQRPRDRLGRPQPWGSPNGLELEDFDHLTIEENHRLAREHLTAARYFPAHEAWETAWMQARDTPAAEICKGASQLGAGLVHLLRGNRHGAVRLLERAASRIGKYPVGHLGVDAPAVAEAAAQLAAAVDRGEIVPGEDVRFTAPVV